MGKPWIEDAKDFHVLDELKGTSLHYTQAIAEYLDPDNTQRTVLLAPKGCGKTLLIKHKRSMMQGGYRLLPNNQLVSLAPGFAPPFSQHSTKHLQEFPDYWSILWQMALCITVLRHANIRVDGLKSRELRAIIDNELLIDAFPIFIQLLYFDPGAYNTAFQDFQSLLVPAFMRCHSPVALFIDNVDECFGHHLLREKRSGLHGQIAAEFWHDAQVGLLIAVRQIGSQNPHVKVFATIRSEAFSARKSVIPDLANVRAHMIPLRFDQDDLRNIFIDNIRQESKSHLVEPGAPDPFVQFFGTQAVKLRHVYTGTTEHVFDYISRHTFGRPRDFMTVGREIAAIRPERRNGKEVRMAVNRAAAEIAKSYLTEVSPHLNWFDEDILFSQLDGNYYSAADIQKIQRRYKARIETASTSDFHSVSNGKSAVSDIYDSGLLGIVKANPIKSEKVQHFQSVFDLNGFAHEMHEPPKADYYLLHNAMGSYLRYRTSSIQWRAHTVNVIAPERVWEDPANMFFVAQLDVCESTRLTEEAANGGMFSDILNNICNEVLATFTYRESVHGDSIAFADHNGYLVVRAAQAIATALKNTMLKADVRVGLDFGAVAPGKSTTKWSWFSQGRPLIRSQRLQSSSAPGHLLTLPHVAEAISSKWDVDWPFRDISDMTVPFKAERTGSGWKVMEKGKDESEIVDSLLALPLLGLDIE